VLCIVLCVGWLPGNARALQAQKVGGGDRFHNRAAAGGRQITSPTPPPLADRHRACALQVEVETTFTRTTKDADATSYRVAGVLSLANPGDKPLPIKYVLVHIAQSMDQPVYVSARLLCRAT